jgi:hypothetical protein
VPIRSKRLSHFIDQVKYSTRIRLVLIGVKFGFVAIPFNSIKLFIKNKVIGGWETKKNVTKTKVVKGIQNDD